MRTVAVLAYNGVSTFGLGVTAEVFGCDRSGEGLPRYDYVVTAHRPGLIRTDVGLPVLGWLPDGSYLSFVADPGAKRLNSYRLRK